MKITLPKIAKGKIKQDSLYTKNKVMAFAIAVG